MLRISKQFQVWFSHLEHIVDIINAIIKQRSLSGYITIEMSDWEPCESCKPDDDGFSERFPLCADCQQSRMNELLGPILKDRAYRAHLARRVLGLPCLEQCPEGPKGHATLVWDTLNLEREEVQAYAIMMKFIFEQFERPRSGYDVTAFEILVGQHEVEEIEYCSECLTKAREKLELNVQIRLCGSCLTMRDAHIQNTFRRQLHHCEPWERYHVHWMLYDEFEDGHKAMGYDLFAEFYLEESGGGDSKIAIIAASLAGTLGLSAFLQKLLFDLFTKSHNDRMYSVTVQHNERMFQETCENNLRMQRIAELQYNLAVKQYFETRKNRAEGSEPTAAEEPVILDLSTMNPEREPMPAEEALQDLMQIRHEQARAQEALAPEIHGGKSALEHTLEDETTLEQPAKTQAGVALRHHFLTKVEGPNKALGGGESSA